MRRRPFRDIAEELELRELTPAQWADEAGVPIERVAYWIALAKLRRGQEAEVLGVNTSCSL